MEVEEIMEEEQTSPYDDAMANASIHTQVNQGNLASSQNRALQYQMEEAEQTLAEAQLDCDRTIDKINHLLKQDVYRMDEAKGIMDWFAIVDAKKRVLTEEGVDKIMQVIQSYINKETLLSNFDEKMIDRRMLEFALALSALLFMKYEVYFRVPTKEECYDILKLRIDEKMETKKMKCRLMSEVFQEDYEKSLILNDLRGREEYELDKIKREKVKLNLREFEMIFVQLKALVEATHNRAWKGEERGSLRRHFNISEVIGAKPQGQERKKWGLF